MLVRGVLRQLIALALLLTCGSGFAADNNYFQRLSDQLRALTAEQRYADALTVANEFERAARETFGDDTIEHAAGLNWQAVLLQMKGRLNEAGPLFERVLAIYERKLPKSHPDTASVLNNLGMHRHWMKDYDAAIRFFQRSLEMRESFRPAEPCQVADSLNNLAHTYLYLERNDESRLLLERARELAREAGKTCSEVLGRVLQNLASALERSGMFDRVEKLLKEAIALQPRSEDTAGNITRAALNNRLGVALSLQGKYENATLFYSEALRLYRLNLQAPSAPLAATLQDFALNELERGNPQIAQDYLSEALTLREASLGRTHIEVARTLSDMAEVAFRRQNQTQAFRLIQRAATNAIAAADLQTEWITLLFQRFVKFAWPVYSASGAPRSEDLLAEVFEMAQRAMYKKTAETVERVARRLAENDEKISHLLREEDDLQQRERELDQQLSGVLARSTEQRTVSDLAVQKEFAEVRQRRKNVALALEAANPQFAALLKQRPLTLREAQDVLKDDEALILLLPLHDALFGFAITRERVAWVKQELPAVELLTYVRELRAGLDVTEASKSQTFSLDLAHRLYARLFDGLEETFVGKSQLFVATTGVLDTLPFHVLVTEKPNVVTHPREKESRYKTAAWLVQRHAVTVLPAAANLKSLRSTRAQLAERPLIAFGNPLLTGDPKNKQDAKRTAVAREWSSCQNIPAAVLASTPAARGFIARTRSKSGVTAVRMTRGLIPTDTLRAQSPLPETAYELCRVASSVGASSEDIYLGSRATESTIRALNTQGELAHYRVIQFATHAAVAGELEGAREPGLLLTPPVEATETDDGYLSRADVLSLHLNADWVVLSACNTAAPGADSAEGLSGLAQAFFHAGARALLVSHWYVDSSAATRLITSTFEAMEKEPGIGQGEALRRAILGYINDADEKHAAPSYWAPFVVVGAGIRD